MLKNASDSRSTLRVETLKLLPNIVEGAVRECPLLPSFQLRLRLTYLRMFAHLQGNNRQMQGKSLFEFRSRIFILTNFYSRTYGLASNREPNATW